MTRKLNRPPLKQYGPIVVKNDSMGLESKDGNYTPIISGFAWISDTVHDQKTGEISYIVTIEPLIGPARSIRIDGKKMISNTQLAALLISGGIIVHSLPNVQFLLNQTLYAGDVVDTPPLELIARPCWFSDHQGFYTGSQAILGRDLKADAYFFEPVVSAPFAVKGTLESWWENIGLHIVANKYVLGMTLLGMASLFLQQAGLGSRIICLWGSKGTGKTLATQCAATIFGNGIDPAAGSYAEDPAYVTKFSATINGIEPMLARYSPLPIVMDEMTEQDTTFMGELAYKVSSGEGKHRMTSSLRQAKANRWQLMVLTTAERPLASCLGSQGKPVLGGMLDRAIDIAINEDGVFSNFGEFGSFKALTRHLKAVCGEHYGAPGQVLLEYAVSNPSAIAARLAELRDVEDALVPPGCGDGERRVVKSFAAGVAAGRIACDAGVFQCDEAEMMAAMEHLTSVWWYYRGGALQAIAEYLANNYERVLCEPPSLSKRAKAFIYELVARDGKEPVQAVIIPDSEFDPAFGAEGPALARELATLNALIREQPNRNKHRFCNNRLFAYVVPLDRVMPYLELALAEREAKDDSAQDKLEELLD